MDIRDRFSQESLDKIKEFLMINNNKSLIFKAEIDENELIQNPSFLAFNKKKELSEIFSKFKKDEVYIRTAKQGQLYPSDLELEISEDLYNKKNVAFCIIDNELEECNFVQDIERTILKNINIENFFSKNGLLSEKIKGFEYRKEQEDMAEAISRAINENQKIIIEAGTGTGKTLGYLIPAIKWAIENEKKIIIATNTINLQEQLINKDIPIAKMVLDEDFDYTLVKGRNNYVCKRLFNELATRKVVDITEYTEEQQKQIEYILNWGLKTETGDKSELPFEVSSDVWELIQSTTELCLGKKCKYRSECFYMKTRREKMEASVLISNHHIFFADLNVRAATDFDSEYLILPRYDLVIFDEAHNIESVARNYFSVEISKFGFTRLLNRVFHRKNNNSALLKLEKSNQELGIRDIDIDNLSQKIKTDIVSLQVIGNDYFNEIITLFDNNQNSTIKKTISSYDMLKSDFFINLREKKVVFLDSLLAFYDLLSRMTEVIERYKEKNPDVINFSNHLNIFKNFIDSFKFINEFSNDEYIYWLDINQKKTNILITATPLNIADLLKKSLFDNLDRIIFASATLLAKNNFDYFKNAIGLSEEDCIEKIIDSPFDYEKQMSVFIPIDIANSDNTISFIDDASDFILDIILKTKGKAFILFTAYTMLNHIYYSLVPKLRKYDFEIFLHGEKPRTQIINEFKKAKNPILFGTTSFWEGVDIQGENLSNVIIVKLPFLVPTDPIIAAISKKIEEEGKNSFSDFQLPEAIIKFKQGLGRLIRTKNDKGNIFILDNRILKKSYGSFFINSIPTKKSIKILKKEEIIELI